MVEFQDWRKCQAPLKVRINTVVEKVAGTSQGKNKLRSGEGGRHLSR